MRDIEIVCEAKSHPTKRATINWMRCNDAGLWQAVTKRRVGSRFRLRDYAGPGQSLDDDDQPVTAARVWELPGEVDTLTARGRFRFPCPLRSDTVTVREEKLMPVLDQLAAAGVTRVRLVRCCAGSAAQTPVTAILVAGSR
jgi:hypothetical protein